MDNSSYIALSRMSGLWRQLEVVGNNMANINTPGFKGQQLAFSEYLLPIKNSDGNFTRRLSFTEDFGVIRDLDPGPMRSTGNPLDVAIQGEGYFVVETEDGPRYTRTGHFTLDNQGQLVTPDGAPVLSTNGRPFFIAPIESAVTITGDGTVSTENGPLGRLRVVRFEDEQDMRKEGDGRYNTDQTPEDVERPKIAQGMLEDSNVNGVVEMTRMIALHRAFESVSRMVDAENDRQRRAIDVFTRPTR